MLHVSKVLPAAANAHVVEQELCCTVVVAIHGAPPTSVTVIVYSVPFAEPFCNRKAVAAPYAIPVAAPPAASVTVAPLSAVTL